MLNESTIGKKVGIHAYEHTTVRYYSPCLGMRCRISFPCISKEKHGVPTASFDLRSMSEAANMRMRPDTRTITGLSAHSRSSSYYKGEGNSEKKLVAQTLTFTASGHAH